MTLPLLPVCTTTRTSPSLRVILVWTFVTGFLGCQSTTYQASKMPDEFRCPPVKDTDHINLGSASRSGSNSSQIGPGDLLEITIATGREGENPHPLKTRVTNDGTVLLPLLGSLPVAGLEPYEIGSNIESLALNQGIYRQPQVVVEVKTKAVNRITVLGKVSEPGVHEVNRGSSDLLSAIASAGGLTEEASTLVDIRKSAQPATESVATSDEQPSGVQLTTYEGAPSKPATRHHRATATTGRAPIDPRSIRVDLTDSNQTEAADLKLRDGDVVHVLPRPERVVYVGGLVRKPGQFTIPRNQDIHLIQAIQMAGDISSPIADKVLVIRRIEGRPEPLVILASISKAKHDGQENFRLASGDVITVEQTASTMVVDTMMNFLRVSVGLAGRATMF
jgi:polysaccharide export outer membrane protein